MQTTQKELIFKIIDSLMKYIVKQAFFEVKLAYLLDCISKIPACVCWFAFSAGSKLILQLVKLPDSQLLATSLLTLA